jgi:hypothetical protein
MVGPLLLLALEGCSVDEPIDESGDDGTGDDGDDGRDDGGGDDGGGDDGGGDGEGSDGYVPTAFTIHAAVGIDGTAGTLHAFTVEGEAIDPWVEIATYDDAGTTCSVFFVMENPEAVVLQAWNFEDATKDIETTSMAHVGFSIPKNAALYSDGKGCESWDPAPYGKLADVIPGHAWGIGFGTLRSDVRVEIETNDEFDPFWENALEAGQLLGASWSADLWEPSTFASHVATASPVDAKWNLEVDENGAPASYLTTAQVTKLPAHLATGVYLLTPIWVWEFETYFGQ